MINPYLDPHFKERMELLPEQNREKPILLLHQEMALPHLKWLITRDRYAYGSGRTEVLAHAFIADAIAEPGLHIYPFDHFESGHKTKELMLERIVRIWQKHYSEGYFFKQNVMNYSFFMTPIQKHD